MSRRFPSRVLLAGAPSGVTAAVRNLIEAEGAAVVHTRGLTDELDRALEGTEPLDGLIVVLPPPSLGLSFLDVEDAQLDASMEGFLDLFGALRRTLPRLADGSGVVVISSRGHLGAWGGVHEMAFAGAAAGLMRSVAMENMPRGIRANVIAVELAGEDRTETSAETIADLAAFLVSDAASGVSGEMLLATKGRTLQAREARDRRRPPAA